MPPFQPSNDLMGDIAIEKKYLPRNSSLIIASTTLPSNQVVGNYTKNWHSTHGLATRAHALRTKSDVDSLIRDCRPVSNGFDANISRQLRMTKNISRSSPDVQQYPIKRPIFPKSSFLRTAQKIRNQRFLTQQQLPPSKVKKMGFFVKKNKIFTEKIF